MQTAPKSMRLHIALMGRVNSGKSSFLNLVSGQDVSISSAEAGTTTDVVEKSQELPPIGPVVWLDTAGFGDTTELSGKRLEKTRTTFERADIVVLVCEGSYIGKYEEEIIDCYDFGYFLKEIVEDDEETEEVEKGFVIAGTKHPANDKITWTKN